MPYFLFKISNQRSYDLVEQHAEYKQARQRVREFRTQADIEPGIVKYRLVFANDASEAKELLAAKREKSYSEDNF